MASLQKILTTAVFAAALGFALYESIAGVRLRAEVSTGRENLNQLMVALQLARLAEKDVTHPRSPPRPTMLATASSRFPPGSDAALEAEITAWLGRVGALRHAIIEHPEQSIPELQLLDDDDWLQSARTVSAWSSEISATGVRTEIDFEPNLVRLRQRAREAFMSAIAGALQSYRADHRGELPADFTQLISLLPSSVDPAIAGRYDFSHEGNRIAIAEKSASAVDPNVLAAFEYDGAHPMHAYSGFETPVERTVREANLRYAAAHGGANATEPAQLVALLSHPLNAIQLAEAFDRLPEIDRPATATTP